MIALPEDFEEPSESAGTMTFWFSEQQRQVINLYWRKQDGFHVVFGRSEKLRPKDMVCRFRGKIFTESSVRPGFRPGFDDAVYVGTGRWSEVIREESETGTPHE